MVNEPGCGTGREPLDLAHLARQTFGDEALAREVLKLFLGQSEKLLAMIAAGAAAGRRDAAHSLKGSARAIGAWAVADRAEAVEAATGGAGDDGIAALTAAVAATAGAIERFIAGGGDGFAKTP